MPLAAVIHKLGLLSRAKRSRTWGSTAVGKNRITVGNVTYEVEGNEVFIGNGVVTVGEDFVCSGLENSVHIYWHGDLASLQTDMAVTCQTIHGEVAANGSVHCETINGNVGVHGSLTVKQCSGNIIAKGFC